MGKRKRKGKGVFVTKNATTLFTQGRQGDLSGNHTPLYTEVFSCRRDGGFCGKISHVNGNSNNSGGGGMKAKQSLAFSPKLSRKIKCLYDFASLAGEKIPLLSEAGLGT